MSWMRWLAALLLVVSVAVAQAGSAEDFVQHVQARECDNAMRARSRAWIVEHPRTFRGPPFLRAGEQVK